MESQSGSNLAEPAGQPTHPLADTDHEGTDHEGSDLVCIVQTM